MPGGVRGRSHSVPLVYGVQYGVHGAPQAIAPPTAVSEMSEMREMLKRQQEQLDQLVGSIAQLQNSNQYRRPPRPGPLIRMRCNEPVYYANECDGEHIPSRSQFPSRPPLEC